MSFHVCVFHRVWQTTNNIRMRHAEERQPSMKYFLRQQRLMDNTPILSCHSSSEYLNRTAVAGHFRSCRPREQHSSLNDAYQRQRTTKIATTEFSRRNKNHI